MTRSGRKNPRRRRRFGRLTGTILQLLRGDSKVRRFAAVGATAAVVNLGLMFALVELFGFQGELMKNLANFLSIELSVFYSFALSRSWTWRDVPRKSGRALFFQFLSFNAAAFVAVLFRVFLFALLEKAGIHYLVNVSLGIGLAAGINYFFSDRLVFRVPSRDSTRSGGRFTGDPGPGA